MKKKETKLIVFISILILLFSFFLFLIFKPYNYEKEYKIDNFTIKEKYNKETKEYTFQVQDKDIIYPFLINHKYLNKRVLIKDIKIFQDKNKEETCILPISSKLDFYPLCSKNNELYTYNLASINIKDFKYPKQDDYNKTYQKITIHNYQDNSYLLYNYKGFYLINKKDNKNISLFDKDVYTIDLLYQMNNYLIIPDYNEDHYFHKFYVIDILNGKKKEIELEFGISYDSIYLGDYKNKIYLLDKKEEKEYKIDLNKLKVEEVEYQILENNKMVNKDFKDIVNKNLNFLSIDEWQYKLEDNNLYWLVNNTKIKISNKNVSKIIKNDKENIYYLVGDELYMYNNYLGEVLLLTNFEWEFNNNNMIYLDK